MRDEIKVVEFEKFNGATIRRTFRPLVVHAQSKDKQTREIVEHLMNKTLISKLLIFYNVPKELHHNIP